MNSCHMACIPKKRYCIIINHITNGPFDKLMKENSLKLESQVMRCYNYQSTLLPHGMSHQQHATMCRYYSPKVARIHGILVYLILDDQNFINLFFDILIFVSKTSSCDIDYSRKTIMPCGHHDVLCNYAVINVNLQLQLQ